MQKLNNIELMNINGGGILSIKIKVFLNGIYNDIRFFVRWYGLKYNIFHF